jgi:ferritin
MTPTVLTALQNQADHERLASAAYLSMSHWCEVEHYSGFATFFKMQSAEETTHADKILDHLVDRDTLPHLGALAAPRCDFKNLNEVAEAAFALEKANTAGVHAAYEAALTEKDYAAQVLLHWFISEQVEEEAWADKLVAKVRAATCAGALTYLDRHIVKELTEK